MHRHRSLPPPDGKWKSSREPQRREGENREHIPVRQSPLQREGPGNGVANLGLGQIELPGEGEAKGGPKQKQQEPFGPVPVSQSAQRHRSAALSVGSKENYRTYWAPAS